MDDLKAERAWFVQNCRDRGGKYVEEYGKLATHLLTESGYQPLSLQEREDIVKAFGFCKSVCCLTTIIRYHDCLLFQHIEDTSTTARMGTHL